MGTLDLGWAAWILLFASSAGTAHIQYLISYSCNSFGVSLQQGLHLLELNDTPCLQHSNLEPQRRGHAMYVVHVHAMYEILN